MTKVMHQLTAKEKAHLVNKDRSTYGSFAEIGAGQEVARWFFKAGIASQTIAKTMSAYDMTFSDAIYGKEKSGRYVVESRLEKMLNHEYDLLQERLGSQRSKDTKFFAFANTVAAKSRSVHQGHGWMGVKFQHELSSAPSEIIIHFNLHDPRNFLQQEAVGIVGVNLIYGALYMNQDPKALLESLSEELGIARIEVDAVRFNGPAFEGVDNRLMCLYLVERGLAKWALFGPKGKVHQPADALYGKNVVVQRGTFRPVTHVHIDMLNCALGTFTSDHSVKKEDAMILMEITMNNLKDAGSVDITDFLARVDVISELGYHVLITNYETIAELSQRLKETRTKCRALVLGVEHLATVFEEGRYDRFDGDVMGAMGLLFGGNASVYIYPDFSKGQLISARDFQPPEQYKNIYNYLIHENLLRDLLECSAQSRDFNTREVLQLIQSGDKKWEECVPKQVAKIIKTKQLFGYAG